jgi:DNA modification methylase
MNRLLELPPYFSTNMGCAYLGDSLKLLPMLESKSVDLICTSPPFALLRKKAYGNVHSSEYVKWFMQFAREFARVLKPQGSLVIDIGGTWVHGHPVRSLYHFELVLQLCKPVEEGGCGFNLAQELYWYNPAELPTPAEGVTVRRERVKDAVNTVWWLSLDEHPKASNVPTNIISASNTSSNDHYLRLCRENGVRPHPARFPRALPESVIGLCTQENDVVLDPFAGSNMTGYVAEKMGRCWIAFEQNEEYLKGASFRFVQNSDFEEVPANEEQDGRLVQFSLQGLF